MVDHRHAGTRGAISLSNCRHFWFTSKPTHGLARHVADRPCKVADQTAHRLIAHRADDDRNRGRGFRGRIGASSRVGVDHVRHSASQLGRQPGRRVQCCWAKRYSNATLRHFDVAEGPQGVHHAGRLVARCARPASTAPPSEECRRGHPKRNSDKSALYSSRKSSLASNRHAAGLV